MMFTSPVSEFLFAAFALLTQVLLVLNFAARNWRPELERKHGWIIYASGLAALPLGLLLGITGHPWYITAAPCIYAGWTGFGYHVDWHRPVAWRKPPYWPIFLPYVGLFIAAQLFIWYPLWFINPGLWVAYGFLYLLQTGLNIFSHRQGERAGNSPRRETLMHQE